MRKVVAALLAGLLLCAQTPMLPGFPPGTFQNRAALYATPAAGYTGPGDINGTAYAFWSTRCITTAYTGNVIDVFDGATGSTTRTLITCSAGGTLNETVNALSVTCAVSCRVKTFFDQSGATNCTTACDMTQATNANRAVLNTSLLGGKIGAVFSGTQCYTSPNNSVGLSQPWTISAVYNPTGLAADGELFADNTASEFLHQAGSTAVSTYAGGGAAQSATASNSATHAVQALFNNTSSSIYVDGSLTSNATAIGTSSIGAGMIIGNVTSCAGGHPYTGNFFEEGMWNTDKTANNSTMNSNQHTYWGF